MPTYEYACAGCGAFEIWRAHHESGAPLRCPTCGAAATRVFAAPAIRSPADPFRSASRAVRARAERSQTGEPVKTFGERLPGRPVPVGSHGHAHAPPGGAGGRRAPARPWQVGH